VSLFYLIVAVIAVVALLVLLVVLHRWACSWSCWSWRSTPRGRRGDGSGAPRLLGRADDPAADPAGRGDRGRGLPPASPRRRAV